MKIETENAVRSILSLDTEVAQSDMERAIMLLHGKVQSDEDLVHVLRYKEVMDLLHVHRRTLEYYINKGYLDRVYGRGERALGVSRDSYLRFTTQRTVVHNKPAKGRKPINGAETTRRWATEFFPNGRNHSHGK